MKIVSKNNIIALIGILVVIVAACSLDRTQLREWAPFGSNDSTLPVDGGASGFAKIAGNALYVAAQRPGMEVIVNIVAIASPGYIAIHELHNGQFGDIIGASPLLVQGGDNNVRVPLMRPIRDGEELAAMLHGEEGAAGFDPSIDLPLSDQAGDIVHMFFSVEKDAVDPSTIQIMF